MLKKTIITKNLILKICFLVFSQISSLEW